MLKNTTPDPGGTYHGLLELVNGVVMYTAQTPTEGLEPWLTDGTTAGTVLVKDICPGSCDGVPEF